MPTERMSLEEFRKQVSGKNWKVDQKQLKTGKHGKGGKRTDCDNRYFRSAMEANLWRYYQWLKKLKQIKEIEYESDEFEFPIKRGTRFYKPDFKITKLDDSIEFVEAKGWLDPKSKTALKRMAQYHPQVVIVYMGVKEYRQIERRVGKLIPGWE